MSAGDWLPEINLQIESVTIRADHRRLRAVWSIEAQQDLSQFHGIEIGTAPTIIDQMIANIFTDGWGCEPPPIDYDWRVEGF